MAVPEVSGTETVSVGRASVESVLLRCDGERPQPGTGDALYQQPKGTCVTKGNEVQGMKVASGYFGIASMHNTMRSWDEWLRRRFRMYIWKQWKLPRTRIKNLMKLGLPRWRACEVACSRKSYWRSSAHASVQMAISNKRLAQAGYYSILDRYESLHLCG